MNTQERQYSPAARALLEHSYFEVRPAGTPLPPQARELLEIVSGEADNASPIGYIAGSYAAFLTAREGEFTVLPGDIDVFAASVPAAVTIREALLDRGYRWKNWTEIAYTLSRPHCLDVQVVKPHPDWTRFPRDIIDSFDMNVCRALVLSEQEIICDREVGGREARLLLINTPLKSLQRVIKYAVRGVTFSEHELLKLFQAWQEMPESKRDDLVSYHALRQQPHEDYDGDEGYGSWYDEEDWWEGE